MNSTTSSSASLLGPPPPAPGGQLSTPAVAVGRFLFSDSNYHRDLHLQLLQDEEGYAPLDQVRPRVGGC